MKYLFLFFLTPFLCCTVSAQTVISTAGTGNTYALAVGISNYQDPSIQQLQYANADAIAFADFLKSKAGGLIPTQNIRLLTDSTATQAAVILSINWLAKVCKKDDIVFFYFSGHGEVENITMFNNAYLICYNTPRETFAGMSFGVDMLNDIANTLSVKTGARVILITDACHSGKMNENNTERNRLVGTQLLTSNEKEIRIASCKPDQVSNESANWGNGRGVFSYYLELGLKGLADKTNDGIVTLGEIKNYLETSMLTDHILKTENKIQTPVLKWNDDNLKLSVVDTAALAAARKLINAIEVDVKENNAANNEIDVEPDDYFISLLKKESLEALTNSLKLDKLSAREIPFAIINSIKDSLKNETGQNKLSALLNHLHSNKESLNNFNERLVIAFDDKAQEVINQYLKGDEAELERRRYYNIKNNGYDVYPKMFAVALQLTEPGSFYYNMLQVKLHYFTGVTLRLKIPVTENPAPLIEQALAHQKKALVLEKHGAYIYNELGILYDLKKQYADAEKYFIKATRENSRWAIPWANLGGLYAATGKTEQGIAACKIADSLQAGLQITNVNMGFGYEKSGNLLYAEEYYRKAIDINSRHYLPFENLGYVYMNTTQYALADSFFYEADLRKKGYHFIGDGLRPGRDKQGLTKKNVITCDFKDTLLFKTTDILAYFAWGVADYYGAHSNEINADGIVPGKKNNSGAIQHFKKVISLDKKNPLVYHYLALVYYEQQQWEEAELMFRYAIENYMDRTAFDHYLDSINRSAAYPYPHDCFENLFNKLYYGREEDYYFIASVHENWNHPDEAAFYYKKAIEKDPADISGYIKLWQLLEKQSLYSEAENVIKRFSSDNSDTVYKELNAFYRRALEKYPDNSEWNYKLGLLLYSRAQVKTKINYRDTIVWFPRINQEVFLPQEISEKWTSEDLQFDIGPGVSDEYHPQEISFENHQHINIPGTGELLYLANSVSFPRYDGIRYLKKAAELIGEKETLASINYKIADMYVWAGSKKQALPYYENSLRFDSSNANTRLNIVDMCTAIYKNWQAKEQLSYLYNKKQINFPHRLLFAKFNMYAGQFTQSKKILDEAEAINPYILPEITDLWGRFYLLANDPNKAISFYKTYLASKPVDANTCYTLARLYAGKKNNSEAFSWLEKAISKGFNYTFILKQDPLMTVLSKTEKWNLVIKKITGKDWHKKNNDSID